MAGYKLDSLENYLKTAGSRDEICAGGLEELKNAFEESSNK